MIQKMKKSTDTFEYRGENYSLIERIDCIDDLIEALRVQDVLTRCLNEYDPDSNHPCFWMVREQESIIKKYMDRIADFDKNVILSNIDSLIKAHGMKMGELEQLLGISTGYISRIAKPESDKRFNIDMLWKISRLFNISLYDLIEVDSTKLTMTEKYLASFLEKLCKDTLDEKIEWNMESADSLNNLEPDINSEVRHPLFSYETFCEECETGHSSPVSRVVMKSRHFDCNTCIAGDCYNFRMKNDSYLYIMNLSKTIYQIGDKEVYVKELWMYNAQSGSVYLCSNKDRAELSNLVDRLYAIISKGMQHPQIKQDFRYVINAYMQDDITDDLENNPF